MCLFVLCVLHPRNIKVLEDIYKTKQIDIKKVTEEMKKVNSNSIDLLVSGRATHLRDPFL